MNSTMNFSNGTDGGMDPINEDSASSASSSSSTFSPPPGSNLLCNSIDSNNTHANAIADSDDGSSRIRREWDHLSNYDRALYMDAIETAIERGLHQRFAIFHSDELSDIQAHRTCGFYLWHRVFVMAYENMLRSLEPRFACLTLPFWDIHREYEKQESTTNSCRSYATCSKIINDVGGIVDNDDFHDRTYFGTKVEGPWHHKPPLQNLRDDNNMVGLIRYDMWFDPIPPEATVLSPENIARVFAMKDRVAFWEVLHHGIHDSIHDTIGGFMRTPVSSIDPLFMPWHSTMELFDSVWEACHGNNENYDDDICVYHAKAEKHFPNISLSTDEVYMKFNATNDIRDDPLIGSYFSQATRFADLWTIRDLDKHHRFRYANLPKNFIDALANNTQACPNGLSSMPSLGRDFLTDDDVAVRQRDPPTFSNEQLDAFKEDWIKGAQAYYYNGDISMDVVAAESKMDFVKCILFEAMDRDTIERWAIDQDAFLKQVVVNERYNTHPLCQKRLSGASAFSGMDDGGGDPSSESAEPPFVDTNNNDGSFDSVPNTTTASSGGVYRQGGSNHSGWQLLAVLLMFLVSKFSR